MIADRRQFLRATGTAFAAFAASGCMREGLATSGGPTNYGPLVADPAGLIDLPAGFSDRVRRSGDRRGLPDRGPRRRAALLLRAAC